MSRHIRYCRSINCMAPAHQESDFCTECANPSLLEDTEPDNPENSSEGATPLDNQVGGNHYKKLKIQVVEYCHANNIPFMEGSAIKYLTRWRDKGGIADLRKAKHFIELLIQLEEVNKPA